MLTTPVGGLPDVLEDGKNALVFNFGDWQELSKKLSFLIENKKNRQEMAEYSRGLVYQRFSVRELNNEVLQIYESIQE